MPGPCKARIDELSPFAPLLKDAGQADISHIPRRALAHAHIAVVNGATGYTRSLESDNAGAYSFQDLPIGEYKITVEEQGFGAIEQPVTLAVGQKGRQDFHLAIGSDQQVVEVRTDTSTLSPDDAVGVPDLLCRWMS